MRRMVLHGIARLHPGHTGDHTPLKALLIDPLLVRLPRMAGDTKMKMTILRLRCQIGQKGKKATHPHLRTIHRSHHNPDPTHQTYPSSPTMPMRSLVILGEDTITRNQKNLPTPLFPHGRLSFYRMKICRYGLQGIGRIRCGMRYGGPDVL